jgi:DnaJ-class molecular chaperone
MSVTAMTHYAVLDMPPGSTHEQLHERFLELSKRYHPDVNGATMAVKQQELNAAWGVLKNAEFRRQYDARLQMQGGQCTQCQGRGLLKRTISFTRHEERLCKSCKGTGQK